MHKISFSGWDISAISNQYLRLLLCVQYLYRHIETSEKKKNSQYSTTIRGILCGWQNVNKIAIASMRTADSAVTALYLIFHLWNSRTANVHNDTAKPVRTCVVCVVRMKNCCVRCQSVYCCETSYTYYIFHKLKIMGKFFLYNRYGV